MKKRSLIVVLSYIFSDIISYIVASLLAFFIRPYIPFFTQLSQEEMKLALYADQYFLWFVLLGAMVYVLSQFFLEEYRTHYFFNTGYVRIKNTITSVFTVSFFFFFLSSVTSLEPLFSRGVIMLTFVFIPMFSLMMKWILDVSIQQLCMYYGYSIPIALIGKKETREQFAQLLPKVYPLFSLSYQGDSIEENVLDTVQEVWCLSDRMEDVSSLVLMTQTHQRIFRLIPHDSHILLSQIEQHECGSYPLFSLYPTPLYGWRYGIKRLMDIIVSIIALFFLFPFFILLAFCIKMDSTGPVFYVSSRVGKNGKLFPMFKFRSMMVNADEIKERLSEYNHRNDSPLFKIKNDPRITSFGHVLRRYSLDELPQFINVLLGHMSIVGPRPHLPNEVEKYKEYQKQVLLIKPGITGMAQVHGRSDLSFDQEIRLDFYYIARWSLLLDLYIFCKTPFVLLLGKGAD